MIIQQKRIISLNSHLGHLRPGQKFFIGFPLPVQHDKLLARIGFTSRHNVGETVLSKPVFGKISSYNAEGKHIVRRDLPKETAYRQVEWHWNEWRGYGETEEMSRIVDVPYERYPREFIPPPGIELSISGSDETGFLVVSPSMEFKSENEDKIIHVINLFLEIFGEAHVLSKDLKAIRIPKVQRVNWTILPQGEYPWEKLKEHVEPILKAASEGKRPVIRNRLEIISGYTPLFVAIGRAGFSGYLIFGFPEKNIYVCESAFYGNATYIFEKDWEQLSKLTKAQILDENLQKDRLIHQEGWGKKVASILRSA